ncbi:protein of unknown function [Pedobacter steynii]|uniref:DUF4843 domain-containing protein n=1 Tax=Pedobacter steynii TaxID=430522 RepID=A0A1G9IRE4_9SPHI|nr:DUF4843 domain-containing protein [Pedobacter steynii]NQX38028.1 DUF4843 domain-containing protein [Pedobacter steynii]SDL27869.1 protein of unknown function [Pedobacter steynii]
MKQPIYITAITLLLLSACKKEEVKLYDGGDRVQFSRLNIPNPPPYIDSLDFSFASKGNLESDTLFLPVDVTGRAVNRDREFKVAAIAEESSAVQGIDFDFGKGIIKAGEFKGVFKLILRKTKDLETIRKKVSFKIIASEDFQPGLSKQLKCKVAFFNFMVKPIDWDTKMLRYFGTYSKAKHRFILYQLGFPEINFAATTALEDPTRYIFSGVKFAYFQLKLRSVLDDLNSRILKPAADDPFTYPLKDENGLNVIFP